MISSNDDEERLKDSRRELLEISQSVELRRAPLLILANKTDCSGALTTTELSIKLGLRAMPRAWHVQATCAVRGDGLVEGLDWLSAHMPPLYF